MKINILTQPLYLNYGGILQNYALQEVLRRMGHEPLTINVPKQEPIHCVRWKDIIKSGINLTKKIQGVYPYPVLSPFKLSKKEYKFSKQIGQFVSKHINKVDENAPFTPEINEKYPADVWIVGSDQVWRPWCSPYIENCFFDFLPKDGPKKIAYAASFGTDRWEISEELTPKIRVLAQNFDAISVRESSGVNLVKDYLGIDAQHVLDPTLLLDAEDYLRLVPSELLAKDVPTLTTYILDPNKEKRKEIKRFAKENNLKINPTGEMHKNGIDSVEKWLSDIAKADYVLTDSFHGVVFSLIFNKPVKFLGNTLRGTTRFFSLINILEIKNVLNSIKIEENNLKVLNIIKNKSLNFLQENL